MKKKSFQGRPRIKEIPWHRPNTVPKDIPHPVVVVNGAFDLLHSGHMRIIHEARKKGKTVIAAMDSDERVSRKGPGRPIQTFIERATTMNFMPVDYIVEIDSDRDMAVLFRNVQPDLRVQGWDYRNSPTKFPAIPKCFVRQGRMRTSEIIERCKRCG